MRYICLIILLGCSLGLQAQTTAQLFEQAKKEANLHTQIELLSRVIEQSPTHVGAYHYRADAYQALGNTRQAMQDYDRVVALRPKDPFRYYARGLAYSHLKEPQLAIADFTKAIRLNPTYQNFYLARAREYRSIGKSGQALTDYQQYAGSWNQAPTELLEEVIPVSLDAYRYDLAQQLLDVLTARSMLTPTAYIWQGRLWQNEGKWDEAISAFSKAINRRTDWAQAYQWRGNAYREMGEWEAALEDYTHVLALEPQAYWFNRRGLVYEDQKQYEKAAADYTQAIELDPKWAVAYNNRGFARMNLKQWERAKADVETAISLDPSAPTPYVNLAGIYWTFKKDKKQMYIYLQKALNHNFKNYDALFDDEQKGWLFKGINQTAQFRSLFYK